MSEREWKPGDVALVGGKYVALVWDDEDLATRRSRLAFVYTDKDGDSCSTWVEGSTARPLVVIDPDDREQVERLVQAWERQTGESAFSTTGRYLQAALREFANPTPPKPEEPTGLGAVVEDAEGVRYVRAGLSHGDVMPDCWRHVSGSNIGYWSEWKHIAAVKVLSEGVTP